VSSESNHFISLRFFAILPYASEDKYFDYTRSQAMPYIFGNDGKSHWVHSSPKGPGFYYDSQGKSFWYGGPGISGMSGDFRGYDGTPTVGGCIVPLIILILVVPVIGFFVLNMPSIGVLSSTPDWALDHFCDDVTHGRMQNAYNLFSNDYRNTHSQADFIQNWSKALSTCAHVLSTSSNGNASGTLTTKDFGFSETITVYQVTLIQDNILDWKINSLNT
jgi:hypothetical protein